MSRSRKARAIDWAAVLDLERAVENTETDLFGDWYRDPWGWPEIPWLATTDGQPFLVQRLNGSGVRHAAKIDVAKSNFGTRPAIVMDPVDRVAYQALVDISSVDLIGELAPFVRGWRLPRKNPRRGRWTDNGKEHESFRQGLSDLSNFYSAVLRTDIVSCFASIDVDLVSDRINEAVGSNATTNRLCDLIHGWSSVSGRSGLAQRSCASAALANLMLQPADDVLARVGRQRRGIATSLFPEGTAVRWMDDIWLFGNNPGQLRAAQVELQDALRHIGLEINHAKTDLLEGDDVEREAKSIKHSAAEGGLLADPIDLTDFEAVVEEVLQAPELASRTTIAFLSKRIRDHSLSGYVERFLAAAERMPHAADTLARLFREMLDTRSLVDWFLDYQRSGWSSIEWSGAQLATMFPSSWPSPPEELVDYFTKQIDSGRSSLPMVAVASHRLSSWAPRNPDIRHAILEAANRTAHPLERRVLALAANQAGVARATVRELLGEFEENSVTKALLEEKRFRVRAVADFG